MNAVAGLSATVDVISFTRKTSKLAFACNSELETTALSLIMLVLRASTFSILGRALEFDSSGNSSKRGVAVVLDGCCKW